jgi:hypothetical protein
LIRGDYDVPTTAGQGAYIGEAKMLRVPTMKDRLEMAVKQAEEKLTAAKRARELFDKNPDLEELLNILQRSNF